MAYSPPLAIDKANAGVPVIRSISVQDVFQALRRGFDDFWEQPSHYVFVVLVYPVIGIVLAYWTSRANVLPLLYPLVSGFALLGPFAAIGLYEMSRRRELQTDGEVSDALGVFQKPNLGSIALMALLLFAVFMAWLMTAELLYTSIMGPAIPDTITGFLGEIFTTSQGWTLIVLGNLIGLVFALFVLTTTVIAFPLLVDRPSGVGAAIDTSMRVFRANPLPMIVWGGIVAVLLMLGSLPIFIGLIIVLPTLGHATWHLYRMTVEPAAHPAAEG